MSETQNKSEEYVNIRDILKPVIGQKLVEITQHDDAEFAAGKDSYVMLMFESGTTVKFNIADNAAYRSGYAINIVEPGDDPKVDGLYHPSKEEEAARGWLVVECLTDDILCGHVLPTWGRLHQVDTAGCWCGATAEDKEPDHRFRRVWTHNEEA